MKRDYLAFLQDILNAIIQIENYAKESDYLRKKETLSALLFDGLIRQIGIIGEASKNIPKEVRVKYPHIPWSDMARTRDVVTHKYWGIDIDTIWEIVNSDLPTLKYNIRAVISEEEDSREEK